MNIPYKSIYHEHNMLIVDNNIFMSIFSNGDKSPNISYHYTIMDDYVKYNNGVLEFRFYGSCLEFNILTSSRINIKLDN